jgi:uncharacterized membrane protein YqjE
MKPEWKKFWGVLLGIASTPALMTLTVVISVFLGHLNIIAPIVAVTSIFFVMGVLFTIKTFRDTGKVSGFWFGALMTSSVVEAYYFVSVL